MRNFTFGTKQKSVLHATQEKRKKEKIRFAKSGLLRVKWYG